MYQRGVTRRTRIRVAMIAGALVIGLVVGGVIVSRDQDDPGSPRGVDNRVTAPPVASGLLPWAPRGSLAGDAALLADATAVWRAGAPVSDIYTSPELATVRPSATVNLVWAGTIGVGRVVVLQSIDTQGDPAVAQVAEHGDPAVLTLDSVGLLPSTLPPALAITYDGNLNMPSLGPGAGAALIEMLPAPDDVVSLSGLWQQRLPDQGGQLQLLKNQDDGMTGTFLQVGDPATSTSPIVLANSTQGRAGVLGTIDVRGGQLIPTPAKIALRDVPAWGPSGRIQGSEYADLTIGQQQAAGGEQTSFAATVVASVSGFLPSGDPVNVRLFAVLDPTDEPVQTLIVVRRDDGVVLCSHLDDVAPGAGDAGSAVPSASASAPTFTVSVIAARCLSETGGVVATMAAAAPGTGTVELSGSGNDTASGGGDEPASVVRLDAYPVGSAEPVTAQLLDAAGNPVRAYGTAVFLPPLDAG